MSHDTTACGGPAACGRCADDALYHKGFRAGRAKDVGCSERTGRERDLWYQGFNDGWPIDDEGV